MEEFNHNTGQKSPNKLVKLAKYMVPTIMLIGVLYYLTSGVFDGESTLKEIENVQNTAKMTTTTVLVKSAGSSDTTVSTKKVVVLGLGDIQSNFDKIYGEPMANDLGFEYQFVGGKVIAMFAPDVNKTNRAWQLFISQKPTSRKNSLAYVGRFIPEDSKLIASSDLELSARLLEYKSDTLASLFSKEMFVDDDGKLDQGYFKVMFDIDESNLVYQIRIVGGFNFY